MGGNWESLDRKVQNIWEALGRTGGNYVLVGGTALAWHLGHRVSYDVDLLSSRPVEHPRALRKRWDSDLIGKHKWVRRSPDHYIKFFATDRAPKIDVHGKSAIGCLAAPVECETGLRLASLTDILKQKLAAMYARESERDAQDVVALLDCGKADMELAVSALRDESGIGIGIEACAELGRKLRASETPQWKGIGGAKALAEALLDTSPQTFYLFHENVEGPAVLARRDSRPKECPSPS